MAAPGTGDRRHRRPGGVGLSALDQVLQQPGEQHPLTLVFGGGPSAAGDVLAAIAGTLISVTGRSITAGFVLALTSVVGPVLFLGHLARSLRVETMLRDVSEEARDTFARELRGRDETPATGVGLPLDPATRVCASRSGFVVDVDGDRIAAAAAAAGAVVLLEPRIGDSVIAAENSTGIGPEEITPWRRELADALVGRWLPATTPVAQACAPWLVRHRTP